MWSGHSDFTPIHAPIAWLKLGVDPVAFRRIMIYNFGDWHHYAPVGGGLYVGASGR